jgi:hypothetical protein
MGQAARVKSAALWEERIMAKCPGLRVLAAGLAGLATTSGAAAQQPSAQASFCNDLRRVLESAAEDTPFRALERSAAAPPRLGFRHCARSGDARQAYWLCSQNLAPDHLSAVGLAEQVRACLPKAVPLVLPARARREARFAVGNATIRIDEHGAPRAHVGRIVTLVVEAPPAGGRE